MWATHVSEVPNHLSTSLPGRRRVILPHRAIHYLPEAVFTEPPPHSSGGRQDAGLGMKVYMVVTEECVVEGMEDCVMAVME